MLKAQRAWLHESLYKLVFHPCLHQAQETTPKQHFYPLLWALPSQTTHDNPLELCILSTFLP